uniref:ATP synthase F0 subunit 6 n=1 Tax=Cephalodiscus hodgsoni TaxID=560606 RepID=A0A481P977_9BILA|nr:ATP synthase F0 subunit 6 [Cephalodiscus hodgsoni]
MNLFCLGCSLWGGFGGVSAGSLFVVQFSKLVGILGFVVIFYLLVWKIYWLKVSRVLGVFELSYVYLGVWGGAGSKWKVVYYNLLCFMLVLSWVGFFPGVSSWVVLYPGLLGFGLVLWFYPWVFVLRWVSGDFFRSLVPRGTPSILRVLVAFTGGLGYVLQPFVLSFRLCVNLACGKLLVVMLCWWVWKGFDIVIYKVLLQSGWGGVIGLLFLTFLGVGFLLFLGILEFLKVHIQLYVFMALLYFYKAFLHPGG